MAGPTAINTIKTDVISAKILWQRNARNLSTDQTDNLHITRYCHSLIRGAKLLQSTL